MKKIAKSLLALTATALVLFSTGCSNDSDDSSSSGGSSSGSAKVTVPTLPAASGTNVLKGKTLMGTDSNDKYVFAEDTFVYFYDENENGNYTQDSEYKYSYNAETGLLSYYMTKIFDNEDNLTITASNYYSMLKQLGYSGDELECNEIYMAKQFSALYQKSVKIDNSTGTLTSYFDGDIKKYFECREDSYTFYGDFIEFRSSESTANNEKVCFSPDFNTSNNKFTAIFFLDKAKDGGITKIGTASGNYTSTSDNIMLEFETVPTHTFEDETKQIKPNVQYTLPIDKDEFSYTITE